MKQLHHVSTAVVAIAPPDVLTTVLALGAWLQLMDAIVEASAAPLTGPNSSRHP